MIGTRQRIHTRGIVHRYLVALEREERERSADRAAELVGSGTGLESGALEPSFIRVAAEFGRRHGITHATWREARVSDAVLQAAGVSGPVDAVI